MASDWEELESWSKEDLIIELMHMRTIYSMLRSEHGDDCRWPDMDVKSIIDDEGFWEPGQLTTDEWAERIAIYAAARATEDFYGGDLIEYGLTDGQGYDVVDRFRAKGRLVLPPGVKFYNPEEYRCPDPVLRNQSPAISLTMKQAAPSRIRYRFHRIGLRPHRTLPHSDH